MTAMKGPMPKRVDQLLGRHPKERFQVDRAPLELDEPLGPEPPDWLSPYAKWFYAQFSYSGQARYYAPSDWAILVMLADMAGALARKPSAVMLASILHGASMLGATEMDRRRMKIELQPAGTEQVDEDAQDREQMAEWESGLALVPPLPAEPIGGVDAVLNAAVIEREEEIEAGREDVRGSADRRNLQLPPGEYEFGDESQSAAIEPPAEPPSPEPDEPLPPVPGKAYGAGMMTDANDALIETAKREAAERRRAAG